MPYSNRDPRRDHNFDNHPYIISGVYALYKDHGKLSLAYARLMYIPHMLTLRLQLPLGSIPGPFGVYQNKGSVLPASLFKQMRTGYADVKPIRDGSRLPQIGVRPL